MTEHVKELLECKIFVIGDKKVGKKSFIKRILKLPSSQIIHNPVAEKEYQKQLTQQKEQIIKDQEQEQILTNINKSKSLNELNTTKTKKFSARKNRRLSSSKSEYNVLTTNNEKTNRSITTTSNNEPPTINKNKFNEVFKTIYKKKPIRPPIPEYPAMLYNIGHSKLIIKIYYIPPAEELPNDFMPRDDEDSEYELEKEHKISLKGVKKDLTEILSSKENVIDQEKVNGYKVENYCLFVFLYDKTNFFTFESLILYYSAIARTFYLEKEENFKACIIGNKIDKRVFLERDQQSLYHEFLKNTHLQIYEMSTKPYFSFNKFFVEFFITNFGQFQTQNLLKQFDFKPKFEKIINQKPNFSRGERSNIVIRQSSPGPEYNVRNVYSFSSLDEIKEVFSKNKSRFNKKIFINKSGPIIVNDNLNRDIFGKNLLDVPDTSQVKGGLLNKPIKGFSFGGIKKNLHLLQERKNKRYERNADLLEKLDGSSSPLCKINKINSKDENYFENVLKRKNSLKNNIIQERKLKLEKIKELHERNLQKIHKEENLNAIKIYKSQSMHKSLSTPDFPIENKNNFINMSYNDIDEEYLRKFNNINKQHYHDIIYSKNKKYLEKFNDRLSLIKKLNISNNEEPGPDCYDVRGNLLNLSKGAKIIGKPKSFRENLNFAPYQKIKDDFDKIAEKVNNFRPHYAERFQKIIKEKNDHIYKDKEIWSRWENNKEIGEKKNKIQEFINNRKKKMIRQNNLLKIRNLQKEQINQMRKEILIQKGYESTDPIKYINYSQVYESSPAYSIKGKNEIKPKKNDDYGNLVLGSDVDMLEYIKQLQRNFPLPNYEITKPKLPSIKFGKAERFPIEKKNYEDKVLLYENGDFSPDAHNNFVFKEQMENMAPRGSLGSPSYRKSPSPLDYKLKSEFDLIVEKGRKISAIRRKIEVNKIKELKRKKEKELQEKMEIDKYLRMEKENMKEKDMEDSNKEDNKNLELRLQ